MPPYVCVRNGHCAWLATTQRERMYEKIRNFGSVFLFVKCCCFFFLLEQRPFDVVCHLKKIFRLNYVLNKLVAIMNITMKRNQLNIDADARGLQNTLQTLKLMRVSYLPIVHFEFEPCPLQGTLTRIRRPNNPFARIRLPKKPKLAGPQFIYSHCFCLYFDLFLIFITIYVSFACPQYIDIRIRNRRAHAHKQFRS